MLSFMDRRIAERVANENDGDVYHVGRVDARIAHILGVPATARTVHLHAHTLAHIVDRRSVSAGEVEFVLHYLPVTIHRPDIVGIEPRDSRRFRLVKFVTSEHRYLHVSLKLVGVSMAEGLAEELWVSSAFPLGGRSLTRLQRREKLHAVDWEAER